MLRLFVAVEVGAAVRQAAVALGQRLVPAARRDRLEVRWIAPGAMHLTLAFLGGVEEPRRAEIELALARAAEGGPIALAARGAGAFPNAKRPRVLWAGLAGDVPALARLQEAVAAVLEPLGFVPEKRGFKPHLTLGRIKTPRPAPRMAESLAQLAAEDLGAWTVDELRLYQSRLGPKGAQYTVLVAWPLGSQV